VLGALYGIVCLRYLASAVAFGARRPVGAPALVCVCVRETSRTSSRWPMIVGGFYSEVVLQKREAEGTVRLNTS